MAGDSGLTEASDEPVAPTTWRSGMPYVVVGVDMRGRKIRVAAPWSTRREEARRAKQVRR